MPFSFERDVWIGPQRLHDLDLFLGTLTPVVEIFVEANELHLVPPPGEAEREAPAAQHVETGGLFGNQHCLTLREDQYLGGEFDLLRAGSDEAERNKGIGEKT